MEPWRMEQKNLLEPRRAQKRKATATTGAAFKLTWEETYFVIQSDNHRVQCLLCNHFLRSKKFNIRRHYDGKHARTHAEIAGEDRIALLAQLKEGLMKANQEEQIEHEESSHEAAVRASYNIALTIAKEGRPFTDGETVKECMISGAEVLCPSEVAKFRAISLSTQTISRRVRELGADLKEQLKNLCMDFVCFSLALDESVDVNDTAQLAVFVRGVTDNFSVTEELLNIVSLRDTTTADDVFIAVEELMDDMELSISKLSSLAIDGENGFGFAEKMREKIHHEGLPQITVVHSLLHPEQLCAKTCNDFQSTLNVVTSCVHFCRKRGFSNNEFREFLNECDSQCRDVTFHCDTRFVSCSKVFHTVFALRKDIASFMESKDSPEPLFNSDEWVANLAFLNDITRHLSELNESMQGQNHLISSMWDRVRAFKLELSWFQKMLLEGNLEEFNSLASLHLPSDYDFSSLAECVKRLLQEFERRFKEIDDMQTDLTIFMTPFFIPYVDAPARFQRELIRFQCNTVLKDRYYATRNLIEFYKYLSIKEFPLLHSLACRFISMFGSTYIGEQIFSVMNLNRCKMRSRLSDDVLEAILRIHSAQKISPNIDALVESKRCQVSSIKMEHDSSTKSDDSSMKIDDPLTKFDDSSTKLDQVSSIKIEKEYVLELFSNPSLPPNKTQNVTIKVKNCIPGERR